VLGLARVAGRINIDPDRFHSTSSVTERIVPSMERSLSMPVQSRASGWSRRNDQPAAESSSR
jgi:hypothetical protein